MTGWEFACIYAILTSFHVPLIKRITTGLKTAKQYTFINSAVSLPLLICLMVIDLTVHHQIHLRTTHWLGMGAPAPFQLQLPYVTVDLQIKWYFWVFVLLASLLQCTGLSRAVEAYSEGELSVVAPIGTLMPIFVALIVWIASGLSTWVAKHSAMVIPGHHLTLKSVFGICAIVAGAFTIVAQTKRGGGVIGWFRSFTTSNKRGMRAYIEARALWVLFPVLLQLALVSMRPLSPYFVSCITVGFMCFYAAPRNSRERTEMAPVIRGMYAGLRRGPRWRAFKPSMCHIGRVLIRKEVPYDREVHDGRLAAAFCLSAGILAAQQYVELNAYSRSNVAVVSAIFKLDVPLVILWGWLFFRESELARRLPSGIVMALGVWLLR